MNEFLLETSVIFFSNSFTIGMSVFFRITFKIKKSYVFVLNNFEKTRFFSSGALTMEMFKNSFNFLINR